MYGSVRQLLVCLKAIAADEEIVIERIKNRMNKEHTAKETSGYRNVCINLRMVGAQARALGW